MKGFFAAVQSKITGMAHTVIFGDVISVPHR
jgi:hypothetical protein